MSGIPQISDAEWQVMKVLWSNAPYTANQVVEALSREVDWKPKTIKTLLNRLVKKKAIDYRLDEKDRRTYHYFPLVEEEDCVKEENQSFLKRVYGGAFNVMFAKFLEEQELSSQDIEELKQILDRREKEK